MAQTVALPAPCAIHTTKPGSMWCRARSATKPHAIPATCKMRTLLLLVLRLAAALVAAVVRATAIGAPREQPVAPLVHGVGLCTCNN